MSQIGILQTEVSSLKKKQLELEQEERGLLKFQQENQSAMKKTEVQMKEKYKYAEEFYDLKSRTTIATRLGDKVTRRYGAINRKKVLINYGAISEEIIEALKKVKIEIQQCQTQITAKEMMIRQQQAIENQQGIQVTEK